MDRTRRLRRDLTYEMSRLRSLEKSVDSAQDDPTAKSLAIQIREQAGVCLHLLDQYQLSVPGRMWSYAERRCQPLRDDLKRTEMLFCDASGEFQRRAEARPYVHQTYDWALDDVYGQQVDLGDLGSSALDPHEATDEVSPFVALSRCYIEAHNRQDLDDLAVLVDEDVEFKRAFDPPLIGKAAVLSQYEQDWADHKGEVVSIKEWFEAEGKVAIEVHVDSGPPSNLRYDGMVVHQWNDDGRLSLYHLYVDEATSVEECS